MNPVWSFIRQIPMEGQFTKYFSKLSKSSKIKKAKKNCHSQEETEVKVAQLCPALCNLMDSNPWNSLGQNTGAGSHSLLQGIFSTQGLNPVLPHCRWILYQLSHEGSPRILEWVAYLISSRSSWPRIQIGVPAFQANSIPTELEEETKKTW